MPTDKESREPTPARRPARDLIEAVLENMRNNLEPLKYSTLAPSRYLVYLHPNEFGRLEGILPRLKSETTRALSEELSRLNRPTPFRRFLGSEPEVESAGVEWQIDFLPDPDGELQEGDVLIHSELMLPSQPELGVGERTRRITTTHIGQRPTATHEQTVSQAPTSAVGSYARILYEDNVGKHTYEVVKDSVTVGRGGIAYSLDIRVDASPDVSREHARIRRDPQSGRFFVIDLSTLGTSVNGRPVPRGYDEVQGTKRENGAEMPLPDRARIGLADVLYLDFETTPR